MHLRIELHSGGSSDEVKAVEARSKMRDHALQARRSAAEKLLACIDPQFRDDEMSILVEDDSRLDAFHDRMTGRRRTSRNLLVAFLAVFVFGFMLVVASANENVQFFGVVLTAAGFIPAIIGFIDMMEHSDSAIRTSIERHAGRIWVVTSRGVEYLAGSSGLLSVRRIGPWNDVGESEGKLRIRGWEKELRIANPVSVGRDMLPDGRDPVELVRDRIEASHRTPASMA